MKPAAPSRLTHALFTMTVRDAAGKTTEWEVEAAATPQLARSGWTEESLTPGEHVTVRAQPDRNRSRAFAAMQSILKEDGTVLSVTPADAAAKSANYRAALEQAKRFVEVVNKYGGKAEILMLRDAGLTGNTHIPFADMNNVAVADLLSEFLETEGLSARRK